MRSWPASKKWSLAIASLFLLGALTAPRQTDSSHSSVAAFFDSVSALGKKASIAQKLADRAKGLCYKGNAASFGFTRGYSAPALTCNGGFSLKFKIPLPIPDCDLFPGGCDLPDPTSCLNKICVASDAAIWDPVTHICGCSGVSVGSAAKNIVKSFLPF